LSGQRAEVRLRRFRRSFQRCHAGPGKGRDAGAQEQADADDPGQRGSKRGIAGFHHAALLFGILAGDRLDDLG